MLSKKWRTEGSNHRATIRVKENEILKTGRKTNGKRLRNRGKEYETVSKSGEKRKFAAKQLGKDCRCSLKCFERVTKQRRENVFGGFWELGD